MGLIYMATNLIDGMQYIGQSKNPWPQRKYRHITAANAGDSSHFHRAIIDHGKENFEWQILCTCDNANLNFAEKYFIFIYGTQEPNGYNILSGGTGEYEYHPNEKAQDNWYESMKDRFFPVKCLETQEVFDTSVIAGEAKNTQPANILKCCKRQRKTAGGYHWCFADENITIEEIENNRKRKPGLAQKVLCIELNMIFDSVRQAAEYFEISPACISNCCNGIQMTAAGYHWRFVD